VTEGGQEIPRVPARETPVWAVIALVVVVTAVVLMILTFVVVLPSLDDGGSGDTPASAMNGFVHDLNDGDIAAALEHTVVKFADSESYWNMYDELDEFFEMLGDYRVTVSNFAVTERDSMTVDEIEECESDVDVIEEVCDITVDDYCILECTLYYTTSNPTIQEEEDVVVMCVLVDGNWYIVTG